MSRPLKLGTQASMVCFVFPFQIPDMMVSKRTVSPS